METKKKNLNPAQEKPVLSDHSGHVGLKNSRRTGRIQHVSPLGMRVLVRLRRDDNRTDTGLYLPEGSKQALQESLVGQVIEVASAVDQDTHEEANVSGIPNGSLVLIPKNVGVKIPWDDSLLLVDTKDVLAIIHDVAVS